MARNASNTRARILAAAIDEFAAHGLAGGRIERITAAAGANPRSVYAYFRSKEDLFHVAVDTVLGAFGAEVPLTPDDLPGFAGRMFDWAAAHPEAVRLNNWRLLEAPLAGPDDSSLYRDVVRDMTRSRRRRVRDGAPPDRVRPADLLILVTSMASAWVSTPADLRSADGRSPDEARRIADHRTALVEAVSRLVGPGTADAGRRSAGRVASGTT